MTDRVGRWAQARASICAIVEVDPDALRTHVVAMLEGDETSPILNFVRVGGSEKSRRRALERIRSDWKDLKSSRNQATNVRKIHA